MNFEDLNDRSKVWIYQADRALNTTEQTQILEKVNQFTANWNSHGKDLVAAGKIIDDHIIALGVDEEDDHICGGAVDASTRFIKQLGKEVNADFFNRLKVLTIDENGNFEYVSHSKLKDVPNRTMYNVAVHSKNAFDQQFKIIVNDYLKSRK